MKKSFWIAILAAHLAGPLALAQAPKSESAPVTRKVAASEAFVPVEQRATKEQLKKLFEVMRLRQQFEDMMKVLPSVVQQQIRAQMTQLKATMPETKQMTPEQQKSLGRIMNKYMEKATTLYPADEMIDDAISVYQKHMTQEDAEAYLTFFSSPPGQHFLDAQPAIMKEYMPIAMERAQRRTQALTADLAKDVSEFAKSAELANRSQAK